MDGPQDMLGLDDDPNQVELHDEVNQNNEILAQQEDPNQLFDHTQRIEECEAIEQIKQLISVGSFPNNSQLATSVLPSPPHTSHHTLNDNPLRPPPEEATDDFARGGLSLRV